MVASSHPSLLSKDFGPFVQYSESTNGFFIDKSNVGGFPGGAVVENPPANAGDKGLSPGLGRSHMPRSN